MSRQRSKADRSASAAVFIFYYLDLDGDPISMVMKGKCKIHLHTPSFRKEWSDRRIVGSGALQRPPPSHYTARGEICQRKAAGPEIGAQHHPGASRHPDLGGAKNSPHRAIFSGGMYVGKNSFCHKCAACGARSVTAETPGVNSAEFTPGVSHVPPWHLKAATRPSKPV